MHRCSERTVGRLASLVPRESDVGQTDGRPPTAAEKWAHPPAPRVKLGWLLGAKRRGRESGFEAVARWLALTLECHASSLDSSRIPKDLQAWSTPPEAGGGRRSDRRWAGGRPSV